ncbi:MAG TPA: hypothetical protein VIL30_04140 [Ramlibacter sp.]
MTKPSSPYPYQHRGTPRRPIVPVPEDWNAVTLREELDAARLLNRVLGWVSLALSCALLAVLLLR